MRTLPSAIDAVCMTRSMKPRMYVELPDVGLFLGTADATLDGNVYGKRLNPVGTIVWDAPLYGGMATVSGITVRNLELGRELELFTEAEIEPLVQAGYIGAARVQKTGIGGETYEDVRGATSGTFATASMNVGRRMYLYGGADAYEVMRGLLQFAVPTGMTSCDEGWIELTGLASYMDAGDELYLVRGSWTTWNARSLYNAMNGWELGLTAYTGAILNEPWHSDQFVAGGRVRLRLNEQGRDHVLTNTGGTVRFMVLLKRDYTGASEPSSDEFMRFETSSARLNLLYNGLDLTNTRAVVYIGEGDGASSTAGLYKRWSGVVDHWTVNDNSLDLELAVDQHRQNLTIPWKIVTRDVFSGCPETNVGKAYPVVYGDFTTEDADLTHDNGIPYFAAHALYDFASYQYGYKTNLLKAIMVKSEHPRKTLLSLLPMKDAENPYYHWNGTRKRYELFLTAPSTDTPSDTEVVESLAKANGYYPGSAVPTALRYGILQAVLPAYHAQSGSGVGDAAKSYTTDPDTYATLTTAGGTIYYYFADEPSVSIPDRFYIMMDVEIISGPTEIEVHWQYSTDDGANWTAWSTFPALAEITDSGQIYARVWSYASSVFTLSNLSNLRVYITKVNSTGTVRIKNVAVATCYGGEDITEVATSGQGVPFGSWVDAYGRSNDYDEDDLIECPPYIIESVARDLMSRATSQIDTAAFDASAVVLADWEMAFQLLEQAESNDTLGELGEQSKSLLWFDEENRLTILAQDDDRTFPNAGTNTPWRPGNRDIFDEDATETGGVFANHMILPGTLTVEPVNQDEVKNEFTLYYMLNHLSGEYEKTLYITNGLGSITSVETNMNAAYIENDVSLTGTGGLKDMCAECYNTIGRTNRMIIRAWAIRDEATATKLLQWHIEQRARIRLKATFTTGYSALAHELWDYINVRGARVLELRGEARMNEQKWKLTRIQQNLDTMTHELQAVEV